jgi:7-carboxy-7-deazaguanine synthase
MPTPRDLAPKSEDESSIRSTNSLRGLDKSQRLAPLAGKPPGTLLIHEIYRSIQGESTFAGLPCVFVRLTACHLRCGYCDTPHAFTQGQSMSLDDVVTQAERLGGTLIEITGGEPLLQPEVLPLMSRLADLGRTVLLETSGACDIAEVDPRVRIILDIKTPGSGEVTANIWGNLKRLKPGDEVKFVVCDLTDFHWSVDVIRSQSLCDRVAVLLAPAFGSVEPRQLAEWILESRLDVRLQMQLHKFVWSPNQRGV